MYYETMQHKRRPVSGPDEAAELIHKHEARQWEALTWKLDDGRELCAVADHTCEKPWFETAVIDLTNWQQIESITMGWIDDAEEKAKYLRECADTDFSMGKPGGAKFPLDGENDDIQGWFECGCCGEGFQSTIAKQKRYDQDNGYGFCPSCVRSYHS